MWKKVVNKVFLGKQHQERYHMSLIVFPQPAYRNIRNIITSLSLQTRHISKYFVMPILDLRKICKI